MINHKVSLRYATSLLESSNEKKSIERIAAEAGDVYKALTGNPQLGRMLGSPVIKTETKLAILQEVFSGKISPELMDFISFIIQKGREDQLINILQKFLELHDQQLGIENVYISSAFELTAAQMDQMKQKFEQKLHKQVRIKVTVDKNLIGGFIAKVNDTMYDASIMHQLDLLKKEFLSGSASLN
jgi:F-type H+-transporting ATPase subunit delta